MLDKAIGPIRGEDRDEPEGDARLTHHLAADEPRIALIAKQNGAMNALRVDRADFGASEAHGMPLGKAVRICPLLFPEFRHRPPRSLSRYYCSLVASGARHGQYATSEQDAPPPSPRPRFLSFRSANCPPSV